VNPIRTIALGVSAILASVSISMIAISGSITAEVWALLLLVPISAGFALTNRSAGEDGQVEIVEDWLEDSQLTNDGGVGDPAEAGFDVPVL
tara:strand:- start:322 stop:594 length:273 start_codon:yes stop_codon:yes gene_type:complete